jgi:hypothetical protein
MLDNMVTRFPNGSNNVFENDVMANLKINDRTRYHEFIDDFDKFTLAQWVQGGAGTEVAAALAAGDGGLLSLVTSAADNDNNWVQQLVTAFTLVAGKKLFFRARVQVDSALQTDIVLGLQIAVAADNILTPADGLFLLKADDGLTFVLQHRVGGVAITSSASPPIANATQFEASFSYDGQGNIAAALNGAVFASITVPTVTAVGLKVTAGVQNGDANARTMLLDQLFCAKER